MSDPSGVVTWPFRLAAPAGVVAAVTTRHGGVSEGVYGTANLGTHVGDDPDRVAENRRRVAAALGVGPLVIAQQEHTRAVAVVDRTTTAEGLVGVDALVTREPDLPLAVLVADCAPVVLVDPVRRAVGVAHAGRRGVVLDVVGAAVAALGDLAGSDPADLRAGVGPCIGAPAYEIDGEALAEVADAFGGGLLTPTAGGRATFDLRGAVVRRLLDAGLAPEHLEVVEATTDTSPDLFSDRAARPCGRFAVVAALRGAADGRR